MKKGCFIILIDRSGSMEERVVFLGAAMTKARAVSIVVNTFIDEIVLRGRGMGTGCDIAVLGYSGDGVQSLVSPQGDFTTPEKLASRSVRKQNVSQERRLPSGRTALMLTDHNVWFEPHAEGLTPMCGALAEALALVEKWCRRRENRDAQPPVVVNITDGEVSDGTEDDVRRIAATICATGTSAGGAMLVNVGLSHNEEDRAVVFPVAADELPVHRYAKLLFEISSPTASENGGARKAVVYNGKITDMVAVMMGQLT